MKTRTQADAIIMQLQRARADADSADAVQVAAWRAHNTPKSNEKAKRLESLSHSGDNEAGQICHECQHVYDDDGALIAAIHHRISIADETVTAIDDEGNQSTLTVPGLRSQLVDGTLDMDDEGNLAPVIPTT